MSIRSKIGFIRTLLIYNYKPFNKSRLRRFYSQFVKNGDLAFDIGAHTGNRSMTWLRLGAKVIAVEPQPILIEYLKEHLGSNRNFTLLEKAIGIKNQLVEFKINELYPSISTVSDEWTSTLKDTQESLVWEKTIEVEMVTLDSLINEYGCPSFCKIDVEGLEHDVLAGLSHPIPALSFEFFSSTLHRTIECLDTLGKIGKYEFNWVLAETFKYQSPNWLTVDEIKSEVSSYKGKKAGDIYCKLLSKELF